MTKRLRHEEKCHAVAEDPCGDARAHGLYRLPASVMGLVFQQIEMSEHRALARTAPHFLRLSRRADAQVSEVYVSNWRDGAPMSAVARMLRTIRPRRLGFRLMPVDDTAGTTADAWNISTPLPTVESLRVCLHRVSLEQPLEAVAIRWFTQLLGAVPNLRELAVEYLWPRCRKVARTGEDSAGPRARVVATARSLDETPRPLR